MYGTATQMAINAELARNQANEPLTLDEPARRGGPRAGPERGRGTTAGRSKTGTTGIETAPPPVRVGQFSHLPYRGNGQ